ncbi:hypothetical protein HK101_007559 [Irineochytrium annulatum]|nr:hypothetical protein HK101_007559 [Irineochytrium annulatum]
MARFLQNSLTTAELFAATPSSLHGIARELETDLRIHGTNQIAAVGILLRLPQTAIATAQTIFHRFYCLVSFKDHRIRDVVLGSVFLASKVEECPRKIRDIIDVYDKLLHPTHVGCDDRAFDAYKECMIQAELQILCRLGFDVQVQHPHGYMINYLQSLGLAEDRVLLQTAWNYLNDRLSAFPFLPYLQRSSSPSCIASAAIFLAARKCGIKLPTSPPWWELFDCGLQDLEAISSHILSLYDRKSLSVSNSEFI